MTRSSNSAMVAARQRPDLVSRDFVSIAGRNRDDNSIVWLHVFSDLGIETVPVLDIETNSAVEHDFIGDGALVSVGAINFVCEQTITDRTLDITLNPLNGFVNNFVRGYDLHEQEIYVYQGDFDPATRKLEAPAECVFAGFVDTNPFNDGAVGDDSTCVINARSHTTELTRTNTAKRSHASEILRNVDDTFYQDTAVVGDWLTYLGQATPQQMKTVTASPAKNGFDLTR